METSKLPEPLLRYPTVTVDPALNPLIVMEAVPSIFTKDVGDPIVLQETGPVLTARAGRDNRETAASVIPIDQTSKISSLYSAGNRRLPADVSTFLLMPSRTSPVAQPAFSPMCKCCADVAGGQVRAKATLSK